MKKTFLILNLFCIVMHLYAQQNNEELDDLRENSLEDLSAQTEGQPDDEYATQQLESYRRHPLNLNDDESALSEFPLIDAVHMRNLLNYRSLLEDLISVYELQAVPGFGSDLIHEMLPFVTTEKSGFSLGTVAERLRGGDHSLLVRSLGNIERAAGFLRDSTGTKKYAGPEIATRLRYRYQYKDLLEYGLVADQDAGEKLRFGKDFQGFDFISWHIFARRLNSIKAIALGDFTVNLGQGLIQWQSLAFTKSSEAMNVKRESESLRPYRSAGEANFFHGVGITIGRGSWEATAFYSSRRLSANRATGADGLNIITALQPSGLHRSASELEDRRSVASVTAGGNIRWSTRSWHIGLNAVANHYSIPLFPREHPYNIFGIRGTNWANASLDFSLMLHNYHFFGEVAIDKTASRAALFGLLASLSRFADLSLVFRHFPARYQSIYGHAFTENTMPTNESGMYLGLHIQPKSTLAIDLYSDVFTFPWLRYRVDAPGYGVEYMFQFRWSPGKLVSVTSRLRSKTKPVDEADTDLVRQVVVNRRLRDWRTGVILQLSPRMRLSSRLDLCWYDKPGQGPPQTGTLEYVDLQYRWHSVPLSVAVRVQHFETAGYDTRLYVYENDVLFATSTPSFFGQGTRTYLTAKYKVKPHWSKGVTVSCGLKLGQTFYVSQGSIGSGLDEIAGNHKTDLRLQLYFEGL